MNEWHNCEAGLVSIIIPSYNSILWISDAINSALQQSYLHCEVIVVDDGSNDGTRDLLLSQYGNRIRYIYQNNKGLSGARNTGLFHSRGEYIQFLDADDIIAYSKIQKQITALSACSGLALCYCDYFRSNLNTNQVLNTRMSPELIHAIPIYDLVSRWEYDLSIPPHCFLFKASIFRKHSIYFDESLPNHEDWDCWMQIFAHSPHIFYVKEPLANYRQHEYSMCKNATRMRSGYLSAIIKQQRIHKNDPILSNLLNAKKKQVRYIYRKYGPMGKIRALVPDKILDVARILIPWRIRRILD
jgi:glycosyltransferase involved in cell wall biosynthesis